MAKAETGGHTVWKYEARVGEVTELHMPRTRDIGPTLMMSENWEHVTFWVEVPARVELELRRFYVTGTGRLVPPDLAVLRYWGAAPSPFVLGAQPQGAIVWHLFEVV